MGRLRRYVARAVGDTSISRRVGSTEHVVRADVYDRETGCGAVVRFAGDDVVLVHPANGASRKLRLLVFGFHKVTAVPPDIV